jgi:hypothetical protein
VEEEGIYFMTDSNQREKYKKGQGLEAPKEPPPETYFLHLGPTS